MTVWLLVGVLGVVAGLLWLRAVERSRRATGRGALGLTRPSANAPGPESREPDAFAG
ncbi:MAG: hypothetical protein ABJA74_15975 [Lapillicoccus sp.]